MHSQFRDVNCHLGGMGVLGYPALEINKGVEGWLYSDLTEQTQEHWTHLTASESQYGFKRPVLIAPH